MMVGEGKRPILGVEAVSRRRFISCVSKEEMSISGWVCSSESSMPLKSMCLVILCTLGFLFPSVTLNTSPEIYICILQS